MGFDVSYHPVDLDFINERLVPCLVGKADLKPLLSEAIALEKLRYRAKAWALGALAADRGAKKPRLPTLDGMLHVWGRPFFIEAKDPAGVSDAIDAYLAAKSSGAIDSLAKKTLAALAPKLKAKIEPDMGQGIPPRDVLLPAVTRDLDVLPEVVAAYAKGKKTMMLPSGDEGAPEAVLASSYPLLALAFMARFRPGWMDRGHVWPTLLMSNAKLDWAKWFEPPNALFGDLAKQLPKLAKLKLSPTVDQNYTVGGYVRKSRVAGLRKLLEKSEKALLAKPKKEGWDDHARTSLRKIHEALADAERRGMGFCEASEIYSAPMGMLN
ncbi:MAG: hypothetical protein KF819_06045 [Labilithrix sp.]|nr:hypothetical protein [Labilithrix sp.]